MTPSCSPFLLYKPVPVGPFRYLDALSLKDSSCASPCLETATCPGCKLTHQHLEIFSVARPLQGHPLPGADIICVPGASQGDVKEGPVS